MSHAVVSAVYTDVTGGPGYRIEGDLFRPGEAPAGAVTLGEIELALPEGLDPTRVVWRLQCRDIFDNQSELLILRGSR